MTSTGESLLLENVSHSARMSFEEPLSIKDQYFIKWLSERFEGRLGTPVITFSCDGILTLVVPTDLQRKRADESKHSSAEPVHKGNDADDH